MYGLSELCSIARLSHSLTYHMVALQKYSLCDRHHAAAPRTRRSSAVGGCWDPLTVTHVLTAALCIFRLQRISAEPDVALDHIA